MDHPTQKLTSKKILSAIAVLITVLGIGLWSASDKIKLSIQSALPQNFNSMSNNLDSLFYTSVGNAPEDFQKPVRKATRKSTYTLEITAVKSKVKANRIVRQLAKKGIQAFYTPLHKQGRVLYRIRTGVFASKKIADKTSKKLHLSKKLTTRTTRLQ